MSASIDVAGLFRLDGKVAIVTGASSGFGARFARVLHAAGARVVIAARRAERLETLAAELEGALPVPCDVTVDADLERLVEQTVSRHGRIDVLVNNAGISDPRPAESETPARFREIVERALRHSLCFGAFEDDQQVGFARVISDYATYAYICDVFVVPSNRGRGIGKRLMAAIMTHPDLQGLRRWTLFTRDAHGLYRQFGFGEPRYPERLMEILSPPYGTPVAREPVA